MAETVNHGLPLDTAGVTNTKISLKAGFKKIDGLLRDPELYTWQAAKPADAAILDRFALPYALSLPADLAGSRANVGTNPTASATIDVQKNGSTVGTIVVATDGTVTLSTTGHVAVSFAAGDLLDLVAPATADATMAEIAITLVGQKA